MGQYTQTIGGAQYQQTDFTIDATQNIQNGTTYTVRMTITDADGDTASRQIQSTAQGGDSKPPATDVYTITNNGNNQLTFEINQGDNPQWNFGDGNTSTSYYIDKTYAQSGNYTVTLTTTVNNIPYTYTETITAEQFSSNPNKPPIEDVISIQNPSWTGPNTRIIQLQQGYNQYWEFGDGTTSESYYNQKTYPASGTYTINATVTIDGTTYQYTTTVTIDN